MLVRTRMLVLCCALALTLASVEVAAAAPDTANASGQAKKGKGKTCKKGYKLKTVTKKNGKQVKVCKKKKAKAKESPPAAGGGGPAATTLFEAPGQQLNGAAAKPFLQKYLANSTFTDCVAGWPACSGFENRFSHAADATFYKCLLRPTSGSDVKSVGEYGSRTRGSNQTAPGSTRSSSTGTGTTPSSNGRSRPPASSTALR